MVLCLGVDGQLSVKLAYEGQCHGEADSHHSQHEMPVMVVNADDDCCAECVDVPLSSEHESPVTYLSGPSLLTDAMLAPILSARGAMSVMDDGWRAPCTVPRAPSGVSPALLAGRNIVLRI